MRSFIFSWLAIFAAAATFFPPLAMARDFLIIAHRGASGERPEHTLAAYERAIDQGADYIEPDLVASKDGILIARHENELSGTTDIGQRAEFASRKTTKAIDGQQVTGWFAEDFGLSELRTLRARERLPQLRLSNARFDGLYSIPTFAEIVALVRAKEAETGRRIGLYPELKHPSHLATVGIDTPTLLLGALRAAGYNDRSDPIFIQSFERGPLEALRPRTTIRLVQLVAAEGAPADRPMMPYAEMMSQSGLREIATYADGIGADLRLILDANAQPTGLAERARKSGLTIHAWTLRKENAFLAPGFRIGAEPAASGRYDELLRRLLAAGVDGVFTDDPVLAVQARSNASAVSGE